MAKHGLTLTAGRGRTKSKGQSKFATEKRGGLRVGSEAAPSSYNRRETGSLDVGWVVEESAELNAAVPDLRKSCRIAIPGIEVGSSIVRWKDDQ